MRAHALAGEGGRMSDTTIVEMPGAQGVSRTPFSWSAAIAGAVAGTAVTFIVAALGSGIDHRFFKG